MPDAASTSTALTVRDLRVGVDQEVRVHDLKLAHALGFGRATSIRVLVRRNQEELGQHGTLHQFGAKSSGGRPGTHFMLNEAQALLVTMFARTERAAEVRKQIIQVFMAFRHGAAQQSSKPALLGKQPETRAVFAGKQLANRLVSRKKQLADIVWCIHRQHGFDVLKADMAAVLAFGIRRNEAPELA